MLLPHWHSKCSVSTLEFLPGMVMCCLDRSAPVYLSEPDGAKVILLKNSHQTELEKGRRVWTSGDPEIKGPRAEKQWPLHCEPMGLIRSHPEDCPNKCIAWVPETTN